MRKQEFLQLRELTSSHFRVLIGVERGMQRHEYVPIDKINAFVRKGKTQVRNLLLELSKSSLVAYNNKRYDGYRLTCLGYDFLALKSFIKNDTLVGFGGEIGVGKESKVHIVFGGDNKPYALKFHRLGQTCFRNVLAKRDYHRNIRHTSWIYLSRIAAKKEYAYLKALYSRKLPVPEPFMWNRHGIVMELVNGKNLSEVRHLEDPGAVYSECMELIVRLASLGVVHGDFNEFNLMLDSNDHITMIDFPQMVSTNHPDAEMYFNRDVECIKTFFRRRFRFDGEDAPEFKRDVDRAGDLDREVEASGYNKQLQELFDKETARLNMNIPETEKRKLPIQRAEDSDDEEEEEDEDDEDPEVEDSERSCEDGEPSEDLAAEECEGRVSDDKNAEEGEDVHAKARDLECSGQASGGAEACFPPEDDSDSCIEEEEDEEEEEEEEEVSSHQKGRRQNSRSSRSVSSAASSSSSTADRTQEIQRRIRSDIRKQKAKEEAQRLRKGIKSAKNNKMRKDNKYTIKTSLSGAWY